MRKRLILALGAATAALSLVSLGAHSSIPIVKAAQVWNVTVGTDVAGGTLSANGFFPDTVTINAGDTVSWTFPSVEPHGVAFDNGHQPTVFEQGFVPDPSTGSVDASFGFNPLNLDKVSGTYNPSVQFSSGVPQEDPANRQPFSLKFATPGVYSYNCPIHGPAMIGHVTVVAASAALPQTPDQAKALGQDELKGATDLAQGPPPPSFQPPFVALPGGGSLQTVAAGLQVGNNLSLLQFAPNNITVHSGDTLVFSATDFSEIHTVTFLPAGQERPFVNATPNPDGTVKLIVDPDVFGPSGGNVFTGDGYLNSGVLFPGQSFVLMVNAAPGTYQFRCLIHGDAPQNMQGTITVVP